jgi:CheY-like chemotaxis protein
MPDSLEILNILIVDDNRNNIFSLRALIEEYLQGVAVIAADSGAEALWKIQQQEIDLVLLDVQMPSMDGFEVAEYIRNRDKTKNIPIVFLTAAYKAEQFQQRGYALGAADYLTKPIDMQQLINRISTYLRFIRQEHQYNRELEQKVRDRTAELSATNAQLQAEIQERLAMEHELRLAKDAAESASRAKSEFLANISHEIRTPLNVILGYAQLLQRDPALPEAVQRGLGMIDSNGAHLLKLFNRILDLSRPEHERMERPQNAGQHLTGVLKEMAYPTQPESAANAESLPDFDGLSIPEDVWARLQENAEFGMITELKQSLDEIGQLGGQHAEFAAHCRRQMISHGTDALLPLLEQIKTG